MVAAGQVILDPLVTAVYPLAEWRTAFERTAAANGMKLVIDPPPEAAATGGAR